LTKRTSSTSFLNGPASRSSAWNRGEAARLLAVEDSMSKTVIGQKEAVSAICKAFAAPAPI